MGAAQKRFLASVEREAAQVGKTRAEYLSFRAETLKVTDAASASIAKIAAGTSNTIGTSARLTREQLLALKYTASDVVASLASGASPLTILLQQGGQVAQVSGGLGGIFRGLLASITPTRLALGATGIAVGVVGKAMFDGSQQAREYADAIILSGNYAGLTAAKFDGLVRSVAASGQVSNAAAREAAQALIQTGAVGPEAFGKATEAAARYAAASGKTAADVAKDFALMGTDATKWAETVGVQTNLVSAAQLQNIKTLQEQGKTTEATGVAMDLMLGRLRSLEQNLGPLDKILREVGNTWSAFWDRAADIGRPQTIEEKIAGVRRQLASLGTTDTGRLNIPAFSSAPALRGDDDDAGRRASLRENTSENLRLLSRSQATQQATAAATAEVARLNREAVGADAFVAGFAKRTKSAEGLKKELAEAAAQFAKQDALAAKDSTYKPSTAGQRDAILAEIRKGYAPDKGIAAGATRLRKSELDAALKGIKERFEVERDAVAFNQRELQALYSAGNVSTTDFYDRRRAIVEEGVAKELAELQAGETRIRQELKNTKYDDPADRVRDESKLAENVAAQAKVRREAAQQVRLATIEEGEAIRQTTERVNQFRESLASLAGDEVKAAALRTQSAVAAAKREQGVVGSGITDEDVRRYGELLVSANAFAEVQRRVGEVTQAAANAEDSYLIRAERSGASLADRERGVYTLRATALVQLGELRDRAIALAEASTDPKVLAYAQALATEYERAAEAVDPTLTRLRESAKDASRSIASDLTSFITEGRKAGDVVQSIAKTVQRTIVDQFITKPLEGAIEGYARRLIDGGKERGGNDAKSARATEADAIVATTTAQTTLRSGLVESVTVVSDFSGAVADAAERLRTLGGDGPKGAGTATQDYRGTELPRELRGSVEQLTRSTEDAAEADYARMLSNDLNVQSVDLSTATIDKNVEGLGQFSSAAAYATTILQSMAGGGNKGSKWVQLLVAVGNAIGAAYGGGGARVQGSTYDYRGSDLPNSLRGGADTGTNLVQRDMVTLIHKGEAIIPARFNPAAGGIGGRTVVNVHNVPGAAVERQEEEVDGNGNRQIAVIMKMVEGRTAARIGKRQSPINASLKSLGVQTNRALPKRS